MSRVGDTVRNLPAGENHRNLLVIDNAASVDQINRIRKAYPGQAVHMRLSLGTRDFAPTARRTRPTDRRMRNRPSGQGAAADSGERLFHDADAVIDTRQCRQDDIAIKAFGWIASRWPSRRGYVDVIVGGQYGSEGKGQIAFYLATEYDLLIRVGGPNAGHKVPTDPVFTHHMLPSGTRRGDAKLLIGPGAVIDEKKLHKEISECKIDKERLSIDPNAMLIEGKDKAAEATSLVARIGSTGSGAGSATARKVMRAKGVRLACDAPDLRPYIRPAAGIIADAIEGGKRIMLEGTQGTSLSIHHGCYPHVTSRETTASGCMADAGIAPSLVRRVIMVTRTYPIRVESPEGKTSGDMYREIGLGTISRRSGIGLGELKKIERTSTTDRPRRIAQFDWAQLRMSALLNRPTDIALTFGDYLSVDNRRAHRFEQLTGETRHMIGEIERVAAAGVSLLAKDFDVRAVLDRRAW